MSWWWQIIRYPVRVHKFVACRALADPARSRDDLVALVGHYRNCCDCGQSPAGTQYWVWGIMLEQWGWLGEGKRLNNREDSATCRSL